MSLIFISIPVTAVHASIGNVLNDESETYIILGADPFFVLGSDNVVQQYPIVKAIYPPPVLVGLEQKRVHFDKFSHKKLVSLVKSLHNVQQKSPNINEGVLIKVTGPLGRKSQAYLPPDLSVVSAFEKYLVNQIEIIINDLQGTKGAYTSFYTQCYLVESTSLSSTLVSPSETVVLPLEFEDVVNKPVYMTYSEASNLTSNNSFYQKYAADGKVFNLVFKPVFSYQNISC